MHVCVFEYMGGWGRREFTLGTYFEVAYLKVYYGGFPGGAVVRNPPANAGDTGSSPGSGRSHMLQSS